MTIVLNEREWAKDKIISRSLGKHPFETLSMVARYYIENNYSKKDVKKMLNTFLIQCDPTASLPKWEKTIDCALDRALKRDSINVNGIQITEPEMRKIESLSGKQLQRLAFTLLCLAKYWEIANPNSNGWVNNKDSEIMTMANINTSVRRQSLLFHTLNAEGLLQFSKKIDNTNVRVCFIESGATALNVTDFRNLGYQYLRYKGEPYFECQNCGVVTREKNSGKGAKQKYCSACAIEVAAKQRIDSVMKKRSVI